MNWFPSILAVIIFIHIFFVIGLLKKDNSVMTFAWPLGLLLIEIISFYNVRDSFNRGQLILLIVTGIWSARLFIHTFLRNLERGYEDFRYKELREKAQDTFILRSYIQFYIIQGVFMLIVGLPFIIANTQSFPMNTITISIGSIIFTVGWILQTIADYQLSRFKKNHGTEEVLTTGVWSLSRHPNYLGEVLVWWGIGLIAFSITEWYVLISPIVVTLLLRYVSGVPLLEERYKDNTDYQNYIEETPPLFPF